MGLVYKVLCLFVLFFSSLGNSQNLVGRVTKVIDGDSFVFQQKDKNQVTIHLDGVDAPEIGQPYSNESKDALEIILLNKDVSVSQVSVNKSMTFGTVFLSGSDVGLGQILSGNAWFYIFSKTRKELKLVEAKARKRKSGLWKFTNPVPPWVYRRSPAYALNNEYSRADKFRVTKSTGIIHNSSCWHFKKGIGKLYPVAELKLGMKNCKLCQGSYAYYLKQINPSAIKPNKYTSIKIGLSLDPADAEDLQMKINRALFDKNINQTVLVKPMFGYDEKTVAIKNNDVDVMESGFLVYYEFKKRRQAGKVILHADYFKNSDDKMFSISGLIIKPKGEVLDLKDIPSKTIFAVSESSSSGYRLQKNLLKSKGILIEANHVKFTKSHEDVEAAVLSNENSIGFVGSFSNINNNDVDIFLETQKTPGGIIFVDESVVNGETLNIITVSIYQKFMSLAMAKKTKRFFVVPLYENYDIFFPNYEQEKSYQLIYFLILVIIVTFIFIKRNRDLKRDLNKNKQITHERYEQLIHELKIDGLIGQITEHPDFRMGQVWVNQLTDNLHKMNRGESKDVIFNLCQASEECINHVVRRINEFINNSKTIKIDNKFRTYLDAFLKRSNELEDSEDKYIFKYDIRNREHLQRMKKIISLNAQFSLLYHYRNLSHHPKDFWMANEQDAQSVLLCYAQVIHVLIISGFFEDDNVSLNVKGVL